MLSTMRLWVAALVAAAFVAGQTKDCEMTCRPKITAATKCSTIACGCYAYDDPVVVSCLQTECGRGYSSVRESIAVTCTYFGVELSPDAPGTDASSSSVTLSTRPGVQPTAASNPLTSAGPGGTQTTPEQGTPSSGSSNGSGGGSGSSGDGSSGGGSADTNSDSNSGSSAPPQKDGLSTAELIGIIVGSVSAVATIIGTWFAIKSWRNRRGQEASDSSAALPSTGYHPPQTSVNNVHNFHVAHTYHGNGPPYGSQPPPPYQAPYMYQK